MRNREGRGGKKLEEGKKNSLSLHIYIHTATNSETRKPTDTHRCNATATLYS
jgi:hypothetical protein